MTFKTIKQLFHSVCCSHELDTNTEKLRKIKEKIEKPLMVRTIYSEWALRKHISTLCIRAANILFDLQIEYILIVQDLRWFACVIVPMLDGDLLHALSVCTERWLATKFVDPMK